MFTRARWVIGLSVLAVAAAGCADEGSSTPTAIPTQPFSGRVVEADFGAKWPFTFGSGQLACKGSKGVGEVTFAANGTTYALNGLARQTGKYADGFEIQAKDANGLAKGDLNAVIAKGLTLCK